jgi:hypothetical protein
MPPSTSFRNISFAIGVYFIFCTVVQFNDPDPVRWSLIYGAAAVVSFWSAFRVVPVIVPGAVAAVAFVWAALLAPEATRASFPELFRSWQMMSPAMEVGREMLGLLITGIWMAVVAYRQRRSAR